MSRSGVYPASCVRGRCGWSPRCGRIRVGVGGDHGGGEKLGIGTRRDAAQVGSSGGDRRRPAAGCDHRGVSRSQALRRENAELRRANEILKAASVFFAAELDRPQPRS